MHPTFRVLGDPEHSLLGPKPKPLFILVRSFLLGGTNSEWSLDSRRYFTYNHFLPSVDFSLKVHFFPLLNTLQLLWAEALRSSPGLSSSCGGNSILLF